MADKIHAEDHTDELVLRRWITVGLPATDLFALWLHPDTLPRIMSHFAKITPVNTSDALWQVDGPLGKHYSWETRIVEAQPGEVIAWRSLEGGDIPNEGELRLRPAPGEWGTELALTLRFTPPAPTESWWLPTSSGPPPPWAPRPRCSTSRFLHRRNCSSTRSDDLCEAT